MQTTKSTLTKTTKKYYGGPYYWTGSYIWGNVNYPGMLYDNALLEKETNEEDKEKTAIGRQWSRMGMFLGLAAILTGCSTMQTAKDMTPITPELRSLVARADKVRVDAAGTPGYEYVGRINGAPVRKILKALKDADQVETKVLNPYHMRNLRSSLDRAEDGVTWPKPPSVTVPRAAAAPVIDGKLDDPAWQHTVTMTNVVPFNQRSGSGPATTWGLAWDEKNLYVAWDCVDRDLVAPAYDRDGAVYNDDCVEIFILPQFRFRTYWELIISPSGAIYDSVQCKRRHLWGADHDTAQNIEGMQIGINVDGTLNQTNDTDNGYTVEVAIPFNQLPGYARLAPKAGETLHFMLARLDKDGETGLKPYAFAPLMGWGHNIWNHALMTLAP